MTLVMYHAEQNELNLWNGLCEIHWKGKPWIVSSSLEIAMSYGWEVIGEL